MANSPDLLLAAIRETVYRRSLPLATRELLIQRSSLGNLAGVIGASAMVVDQLFARESIGRWLAAGTPTGVPEVALARTPADRLSPRRRPSSAMTSRPGWPRSSDAGTSGVTGPPGSREDRGLGGAGRQQPDLAGGQDRGHAQGDAVGRRLGGAVGPRGLAGRRRELDDAGRGDRRRARLVHADVAVAHRGRAHEVQPAARRHAASTRAGLAAGTSSTSKAMTRRLAVESRSSNARRSVGVATRRRAPAAARGTRRGARPSAAEASTPRRASTPGSAAYAGERRGARGQAHDEPGPGRQPVGQEPATCSPNAAAGTMSSRFAVTRPRRPGR